MLRYVLLQVFGRVSRKHCSSTVAVCAQALLLALVAVRAHATDQFQFYFSGGVADTGLISGVALDQNGDFWLAGTGIEQRIRLIEESGGNWSGTDMVISEEITLMQRSTDLASGFANSGGGWGGNGAISSLQLNPAPLTIDVPIGGGNTQSITYPAGTIAFLTDRYSVVTEPGGTRRYDATKLMYRYDLRQVTASTSMLPDFATAQFFTGGPVFGSLGTADWNDVFQPVVSELDLRNETGGTGGDSFGRQIAWSTDGQSIYTVESSSSFGGIYRIDPTRSANDPDGLTRIWADGESDSENGLIAMRSEPGVLHTTAYDYAPSNPKVGDQIIVEGSLLGGNSGGVNVFVDDGANALAAPDALFTEAEFRSFADYYAESTPRYISIIADQTGDLYISEQQTRLLFRYDTEGRFSKVFGERELDTFQSANASSTNNDVISKLSLRTSDAAGFPLPEVIYADREVNAPVGVLAFLPGDFDRDNDLDAADLSAFAAALTTRNTQVDDAFLAFDMNGNERAFRDVDNEGNPIIRHEGDSPVIVDWRDVKILQEFALFPNGDTNFDFALDFTDLDTMSANYYTVAGQNAETWTDGDFASIDPEYIFDAPDANLVNEVDLQVIADAWINDLGQAAPTDVELGARYSGQFLTDAIAAFSGVGSLPGDYDLDGDVDGADYDTWVAAFGTTGVGLPADGNGDGVVGIEDYTTWRDNLVVDPASADYNNNGVVDIGDYTTWRDSVGQTGPGLPADGNGDGVVDNNDYYRWRDAFGLPVPALAIPEPSALILLLSALATRPRKELR